jgi:hypothetical protein
MKLIDLKRSVAVATVLSALLTVNLVAADQNGASASPVLLGIPSGTWQDRYIDWFRDLGFLQKPGAATNAQSSATPQTKPNP